MLVLGVDPGLAAVGLALVYMDTNTSKFTGCQLDQVLTEKGDGPRTADDLIRYTTIQAYLRRWMGSANVVCVEAFSSRSQPGKSGARSAGAGAKTAVVFGMVLGMALPRTVKVLHPVQTRARLGLDRGASKEDAHQMACRLVPGAAELLQAVKKSHREHVGDALALAVAGCLG